MGVLTACSSFCKFRVDLASLTSIQLASISFGGRDWPLLVCLCGRDSTVTALAKNITYHYCTTIDNYRPILKSSAAVITGITHNKSGLKLVCSEQTWFVRLVLVGESARSLRYIPVVFGAVV